MSENLNKIWAKSKPLNEYFQELVSETEFDAPSYEKMEKLLKSDSPTTRLEILANSAAGLSRAVRDRDHKAVALQALRNQLVGESIILVGRTFPYGGPAEFKILDAQFWIGAILKPELDEAECNGIKVDQLRVIDPVATTVIEELSTSKPDAGHETFERAPAPIALRPMAIAACFDEKQIDFDDMTTRTRIPVYTAWIQNKYPYFDTEQGGFSFKSWQKNETEFKKNKGL